MTLSDIDWRPDDRKLRQFAGIFLVGFLIIGALVGWRLGVFAGRAPWTVPLWLWGAGAVVGAAGLAVPRLVKWVYLVWMALAFPIGFVVSFLLLALVFYGLFAPLALFFRVTGRDALQRRFEPGRDSYWSDLGESPARESYFRQF